MSKTTILIVEDEAIVAADLAGKLARLGYEVAGLAAQGEEAVALARRLRPQLVLMDIWLKGPMDGIEAAEAIRHQHDVPVVYLTAHSDPATLARAKLTGPFGYILKPFEERELATQIEMALYRHQADRQLRQQREWLRVTLTSIGDAVIATDAEGRITFVNPVAESLTGWNAEQAAGQPVQCVFRIVNEQTGQAVEDPVARVLREGRAVDLANHTALVTKDGRTVPIEDSAAPILDAAGQVIGAVLVFHDVTEKRRAEEYLRRSRDELETRVEARTAELAGTVEVLKQEVKERQAAQDAIKAERQRFHDVLDILPAYVVLLTPDYHVPFANRFFEDRFGKSEGRRCYEYLFQRAEPCETCETYQVLKTGAPHRWEWIGPDGRNYDIYDFPFTDVDGSPLIMEVGLDITERKQAEAAVQAERRRLFDVLETLPPMVCLLTLDYHVAFANRSFREKFGESHGRHCYEYCFRRTAPCEFCESYTVLKTGQPHHWEVNGTDGSVISAYDYPFTDVDGSPMILEMDIDITEVRRAQRMLTEANESLEHRVAERTAALAESEERIKTLTANLTSGVALIDENGELSLFNPAFLKMFGLAENESVMNINDRNWGDWQVFDEDGEPLHVDNHPVRKAALTGEAVRNELVGVKLPSGGDVVWMLVSATPTTAAHGRPAIICTYHDITAQAGGRGPRAGQGCRRSSQRGQEPVPGQHESRTAHAHERHPGHDRRGTAEGIGPHGPGLPANGQRIGRFTPDASERSLGFRQDRVGQTGTGPRPLQLAAHVGPDYASPRGASQREGACFLLPRARRHAGCADG